MTHSYVWHISSILVRWFVHICSVTDSYVWHDSFIRMTRVIHICDMTHPHVWHDSIVALHVYSTRATWFIHTCDMTLSSMHIRHVPQISAVMSHLCPRHVTYMTESRHIHDWVTSHVWTSHGTHMTESCHTPECDISQTKVWGSYD